MSRSFLVGLGLSNQLRVIAPPAFATLFETVCGDVSKLKDGIRIDLWSEPEAGQRWPSHFRASGKDVSLGMSACTVSIGRTKIKADKDLEWGRVNVEFVEQNGVWSAYLPFADMRKRVLRGKQRELAFAKQSRTRPAPKPTETPPVSEKTVAPARSDYADLVDAVKVINDQKLQHGDRIVLTISEVGTLIVDVITRLGV